MIPDERDSSPVDIVSYILRDPRARLGLGGASNAKMSLSLFEFRLLFGSGLPCESKAIAEMWTSLTWPTLPKTHYWGQGPL